MNEEALKDLAAYITEKLDGQIGSAIVSFGELTLGVEAVVGEAVDQALLHQAHQLAHLEAAPAQVDEQIHHQLARAVVGDLPAAVDLDHRDVGGAQQMLRLARLPEGVDRRMLQPPQLVGGVVVAPVGEGLHRAPGRLVGRAAQFAHHAGRRPARAHSTTLTIGWLESSRYSASSCACDTAATVQVSAR